MRSRLRTAIDAGEVVFAPLALDALTARIAQQAGFNAVYVSGGALGYAHAVIYRTFASLAGLEPLYAIEDETTERSP